MEFRDDALILDKPPNDLDELVLGVTGILDRVGIEYVVVSGYVAVLLGRARATEDVDVITERFDEATAAVRNVIPTVLDRLSKHRRSDFLGRRHLLCREND